MCCQQFHLDVLKTDEDAKARIRELFAKNENGCEIRV
jgi:hypothetical protein